MSDCSPLIPVTDLTPLPPATDVIPSFRGNLQAQIAADAQSLILNSSGRSDGFSEPVTYCLAGDSDLATSIEVVIEADRREDLDDVGDEEAIERIKVFCLRDETTGIQSPAITDTLTRDGDLRSYLFTGEILDENQTSWVLVFQRRKRTGRGAQR
jgi:hypothetical protein